MGNKISLDIEYNNSKKRKVALFIMNFPLIWSFTAMFWFPKGVNYVPPIVIAGCASSIYLFGIKELSQNFLNTTLAKLILVISVYCIFQYLYHGSSSREMRAYITCLFFISCFNKKGLDNRYIFFLIGIAACGVLATTAIQAFYLTISRVHGFINPIVYATYSASIAIMCFCLFIDQKKSIAGKIFFLLFILLTICTLLTGSRGVWIALFIAFVFITGVECNHHIFKRKIIIVILPFLIIVAIALFYPFAVHRLKTTVNEIEQLKSGRIDNNIGIRLQLWSAAMELSKISPVIGLGDSHLVELEKLYKNKIISIKALKHTHYHNNYLDTLVKKGLVGLILLLLLLIFPIIASRKKVYQPWVRNITLSLFLIYSISGLTDVPLNHDSTIYLYVFFTSVITTPMRS